ncbi:OmpP1/FadL family transporter [Rubellimicrobium aerolatum]|uniref:OmpP1/FadL family transporter n=1 Tax=Rubellimicrobium aerolatum TaxID=490979 RepID=A0ABW0S869_9RHOB|nr:outer membrane protein transport protein [Rubellimicrobium aerolatum]MBP1804335.1 long-subunit fatty acid transport protein [Rubellimicrobium aerolatum]
MKSIAWGTLALLAVPTLAGAGALDRTGQPVSILFAEGTYAELSFGWTDPDVQGAVVGLSSGDVAPGYAQAALSFKTDLGPRLSAALILEAPFGADVDYDETDPGYPIAGSSAKIDTSGITAIGRYRINDAFSVHAGLRRVTVSPDLSASVTIPGSGGIIGSYDGDFESDSDTGYVVGAAYERPQIGLRVALTYSSETSFSNETAYRVVNLPGPAEAEGLSTDYTLPQSVNLDVQTGIAANTLLFGSIRWADWSETEVVVPGPYPSNPVVSYEEDIVTYTLGIGRRISDRLSGSASVIYEPETGSDFDPAVAGSGVSNLAPTTGQLGLQLAASYAVTERIEVGGGIRYTRLGDTTTRGIGAEFEDNDALSLGLRVGVRF